MKMSDLLRDLADLMDQKQQGSQGADMSQNSTQQRMDPVEPTVPELDDNPIMVPPLQQKLELLKKASGVASHYDHEGSSPDELAQVKKNAGLTAVIQHEAGEDNDITG
jgi:hypothetical protein